MSAKRPLVVDASVAVKWLIDFSDSERAMTSFREDLDAHAPDLVVAEVANAAWKLAKAGQIEDSQGILVASAVSLAFSRLVPATDLVEGAYKIATELRHPIYDCLYLRLAQLESTRLLTADERLIESVRGSRWEGLPLALDDLE